MYATAAAKQLSSREDACDTSSISGDVKKRRRKCSTCGRHGHDRRHCEALSRSTRPFDPWADLEWEEHEEARRIVDEHPDGMTLEEVGGVLGITRERVRQIEAGALWKLRNGDGAPTLDIDGQTITLVECERCAEFFMRRGRAKICEVCAAPNVVRLPRRRPAAPKAPPKPRKRRDASVFPRLMLALDFSGWR